MNVLTADRPRRMPLSRPWGLAVLAACAAFPDALLAASGRDLVFGYTWRDSADGATMEMATYDGPFQSTNPANNSAPQGPINMGFTDPFPYYGATATAVYISDNGWISFSAAAPGGAFPTPAAAMPSAANPQGGILAPFWSDLTANTVIDGDAVRWGRISSIDAFKIQFVGKDASNGDQLVWWDVILYSDGRIKFQYTSPTTLIGNATIGLENQAGTDGIQIAAGGTVAPGVALGPDYAIEFAPPLVLPGQCASIPDRGCGSFNGSLPGTGPAYVLYYGCGTSRNEGREAVQSFTLTEPSEVTVTLTAARAMNVYLLDACNERNCMRGPFTSTSIPLGAGTYYVVVDAPLRGDEGNYTLDVACRPLGSPPLACGSGAAGTTAGGTSFWASYPCTGVTDYSGTEATHVVDIATATNLFATLTSGGGAADVIILDAGPGEITADRCLAADDLAAVAWNAQPGPFLVVVDSGPGGGGAYDLATDCRIAVDCLSLQGTVDFGVARTQTIIGDTTGGTDAVQTYACDPATTLDGPEHVYEIVLTEPGIVGVYAYSVAPGLSVQVLDGCNEGSCVGTGAESACSLELGVGTHYLVVDGAFGAAGAYELLITFENPFNRWSACMDPYGATTLDDVSSTFWNFNDYAFCPDIPGARNYPDGCVFAMYLTANCGTALHIPLYDSESGHVRVFDLFRGEYVYLTAISGGGWFAEGTDIQWRDPDCEFGSDPRWNEVVTDVFFERPEGLCGIYRLEFPNHSGFVWELYSNCGGDQRRGFEIHDSLCAALAAYNPLPSVTIESASATYNCPEITVTYTVLNNGCVPINDFPVQLFNAFTPVYTDTIPRLETGETLTRIFTTTFPVTPTGRVTIQADPANVLLECSEAPGFSCGAATDIDLVQLPGCTDACQVVAQARATPDAACVGTPIQIDASASSASACPGGALEYQLRGPTGTISWQPLATFDGLLPATSANYTVEVRCRDLPTCEHSRSVSVTIERPPTFDAASVQAVDAATCNNGVRLTWSAATFHGTTGTGHYNVYRSDVSCAAALAGGLLQSGIDVLTYNDTTTTTGGVYFYVVEAEDAQSAAYCTPVGPRNGGMVTRVDANGGTCVAITDENAVAPDMLPRVGGTLRAGGDDGAGMRRYGETFVELRWGVDRPLGVLRGEHYHVYRSAMPNSGWGRITTDAPFLQLEMFSDLGAEQPNDRTYIWFYRVFVSDSCDNENSATDGGDGG